MKTLKKITASVLAMLLLAAMPTGCGKRSSEFQILFAAPFVNEELVASYDAELPKEGEMPLQCSYFSFGSEELDAVVYASGAMAMTAMLSAGEVDVLVCDLENAVRYARSGAFYDLADIFTPEELAEFGESLLTFDVIDPYGEPTGDTIDRCGIDLSGRDSLTRILGEDSCGVFVVVSARDLDLAREIVRELVNAQ